MVKKYILGNWKMHGTPVQAQTLAETISHHASTRLAHVVLFPPTLLLCIVKESLEGSDICLGAQDVSTELDGAFTGDVSASMLKHAGCTYVIVGHSERRKGHGESDALVARKAKAAIGAGLLPIICVGESLAERQSGNYLKIITSQLTHSLPVGVTGGYIIAYEPVWAIGSGITPTLSQISEVHKTIASALSYATSGARVPIVYGGSVKAENAKSILSAQGVDGVLVGGASLKADEFCAIIEAAR